MAQDLHRFILQDVPQPPADPQQKQWMKDRATALYYMVQSTEPIHRELWNRGLTEKEDNPKVYYDLVCKVVRQISEEQIGTLIAELGRISRETYDSMDTFVQRITYLIKRCDQVEMGFTDKFKIWVTLNRIKEPYPVKYEYFKRDYEKGKLTWDLLMADLRKEGQTEKINSKGTNFANFKKKEPKKNGKS